MYGQESKITKYWYMWWSPSRTKLKDKEESYEIFLKKTKNINNLNYELVKQVIIIT